MSHSPPLPLTSWPVPGILGLWSVSVSSGKVSSAPSLLVAGGSKVPSGGCCVDEVSQYGSIFGCLEITKSIQEFRDLSIPLDSSGMHGLRGSSVSSGSLAQPLTGECVIAEIPMGSLGSSVIASN